MLLDMDQRHFGRRRMGRDQALVPGHLGHDRDRFGRGQRNVPAGAMLDLAAARGAKLFARNAPLQHGAELLAINLA
jgi:hypothetical protein